MKGYLTPFGYRGYIHGNWILFATQEEYEEAYRNENNSI